MHHGCAFAAGINTPTPIFVIPGVKVNQHNYLNDVVKKHLMARINSNFGNEAYVFQQDLAPALKANMVKDRCKKELSLRLHLSAGVSWTTLS